MSHKFDVIIIGAGLTGLMISRVLLEKGLKVALVDEHERWGGVHHVTNIADQKMDNGFRFIPDTESARAALSFFNKYTGAYSDIQSVENQLITYEAGEFKSFVGFGDEAPEFYSELSYFLSPQKIKLTTPIYSWCESLAPEEGLTYLPRSIVTKIEVQDGLATNLTINGSKNLGARYVIYTGTLPDLAKLLPEETLSAKARQRLLKASYSSALSLSLAHNKISEQIDPLNVLIGHSQEGLEVALGEFSSTIEATQTSQWLSFISQNEVEDTERVAHHFKAMKRLIKRAYPDLQIKQERIALFPHYAGGEIKLKEDLSLPQASNLFVARAGASEDKDNLLSSLRLAEKISQLELHNPSPELKAPEAQI